MAVTGAVIVVVVVVVDMVVVEEGRGEVVVAGLVCGKDYAVSHLRA